MAKRFDRILLAVAAILVAACVVCAIVFSVGSRSETAYAATQHAEIFGNDNHGDNHAGTRLTESFLNSHIDEEGNYSLPSGNYFLGSNLTLSKKLYFVGSVNFCLNGYMLTTTAGPVITINDGVSSATTEHKSHEYCRIFDCHPSNCNVGAHKQHKFKNPIDNNEMTVDGGLITGGNGGGISIYSGILYIYNGTIAGNKSYYGGGGVSVTSGEFRMYGTATVMYNTAGWYGAGVAMGNNTKFLMKGGTIRDNGVPMEDYSRGGGVYLARGSRFEMSAGTIRNNSAIRGGGVYFVASTGGDNPAHVLLSGTAQIYDNKDEGKGEPVNIRGEDTGTVEVGGTFLAGVKIMLSSNTSKLKISGYDPTGQKLAPYEIFSDETGNKTVVYDKYAENGFKWLDSHKHGDTVFKPLTLAMVETFSYVLPTGNYYLAESFGVHNTLKLSEGTQLCFNCNHIINYCDASYTIELRDNCVLTNCKMGGGGNISVYSPVKKALGEEPVLGVPDQAGHIFCGILDSKRNGGIIVRGNASMDGYGDGYVTVYGGHTEYGAGVYVESGSFTMNKGKITDCLAEENGGGIYVASGELHLNGGEISHNIANYQGGGLFVSRGAVTGKAPFKITNNIAVFDGGGIATEEEATFELADLSVSENRAATGGGMFAWIANVTGGKFDKNVTEDKQDNYQSYELGGGGIFVMEGGTITGTEITNNTAEADGGGVFSSYDDLRLVDVTISGNTSKGHGGGVFVVDGSLEISGNSVIKNNDAKGGGHSYSCDGSAPGEGGGIYSMGSLTIKGLTLENNKATSRAPELNIAGGRTTLADNGLTVSHSDDTGHILVNQRGTLEIASIQPLTSLANGNANVTLENENCKISLASSLKADSTSPKGKVKVGYANMETFGTLVSKQSADCDVDVSQYFEYVAYDGVTLCSAVTKDVVETNSTHSLVIDEGGVKFYDYEDVYTTKHTMTCSLKCERCGEKVSDITVDSISNEEATRPSCTQPGTWRYYYALTTAEIVDSLFDSLGDKARYYTVSSEYRTSREIAGESPAGHGWTIKKQGPVSDVIVATCNNPDHDEERDGCKQTMTIEYHGLVSHEGTFGYMYDGKPYELNISDPDGFREHVPGFRQEILYDDPLDSDIGLKNVDEIKNAGEYTVEVYTEASQYSVILVDIKVRKATLNFSLNKSESTYSGKDMDGIEVTFDRMATGDTLVKGTDYKIKFNDNYALPKDAGTYSVGIELLDTETANNYTCSDKWNFVISKAKLERPTGQASQSFVYNGGTQAMTIEGFVAERMTNAVTEGAEFVGSQFLAKDVKQGGYQLTVSIADKKNYEWKDGGSDDVKFVMDITKAALTIPDLQSATYTGKSFDLLSTIAGVGGDSLSKGTDYVVKYNGSDALPLAAGTYDVTVELEATPLADNYTCTDQKQFDIDKAQLTRPSADNSALEVIYNGSSQAMSIEGFISEHMISEVSDGASFVASSGLFSAKDVKDGGYKLTISIADKKNFEWTDGESGNVEFSISISKAELTFSVPQNDVYTGATFDLLSTIAGAGEDILEKGTDYVVKYDDGDDLPLDADTYVVTVKLKETKLANNYVCSAEQNYIVAKAKITENENFAAYKSGKEQIYEPSKATALNFPAYGQDGFPFDSVGGNAISAKYIVNKYGLSDGHADTSTIVAYLDELKSGEHSEDWKEYDNSMDAQDPYSYCVFFKLEAQNHETYFGYYIYNIFGALYTITLSDFDLDLGALYYGDKTIAADELKNKLKDNTASIIASAEDMSENIKEDLFDDPNFKVYLAKDGARYLGETYAVGEYSVHASYVESGVADKYISFEWRVSGSDGDGRPTFAVAKREITFAIVGSVRETYKGSAFDDVNVSFTGLQNEDLRKGVDYNVKFDGSLALPFAAKEYAVTVELKDTEIANHYTVKAGENAKFTVDKAALAFEPQETTYNGREFALFATLKGVGGEVLKRDEDYFVKYGGKDDLPIAAGSYEVTVELSKTTSLAKNYVCEGSKQFKIARAKITRPQAASNELTAKYNGFDQTINISGFVSERMTARATEGSYFNIATGQFSAHNVGDDAYQLTISLTDDENYEWADGKNDDVNFMIAITKATLTLPALQNDVYTGSPYDLYSTLTGEGNDVLIKGRDYKVKYNDGDTLPLAAGTYTVTIELLGTAPANNYVCEARSVYTISKAKLMRPTTAQKQLSATYNGVEQTINIGGFVSDRMTALATEGSSFNALTGTFSAKNVNNGGYKLTISIADKKNFEWTDGGSDDVDFTISISQAELAFAVPQNDVYTGVAFDLLGTISGLGNDTLRKGVDYNVNYDGENALPLAADTYVVTVELKETELANNYTCSGSQQYTIAKAKLARPTGQTSQTFVYNGFEQSMSIRGFVAERMTKNVSDGASFEGGLFSAKNVKDDGYTLSISLTDANNYEWSESGTADVVFTLTISKATLDFDVPQGDIFSGRAFSLLPTLRGLGNDILIRDADYAVKYDGKDDLPVAAGSYDVTVELSKTTSLAKNYVCEGSKQYTIAKAKLARPTAQSNEVSYIYTGETQEMTIEGFDSEHMSATVTDGASFGATTGTFAAKDVVDGGYTLTISITDTTNYEWTDGSMGDVKFMINIGKAALDFALEEGESYDPSGYDILSTIRGKARDVLMKGVDYKLKFNDSYAVPTSTGVYSVKAEPLDTRLANNYQLSSEAKTFSITKKQLAKPTIESVSLTYNGQTQFARISGFDYGTMTADSEDFMGDRLNGVNAGTYSVVISIVDADNYQWADGSEDPITLTFDIARAALTFEAMGEGVFDGEEKAANIIFGGLSGDDFLIAGEDYAVKYNGGDALPIYAGSYTVSVQLLDTIYANNYVMTTASQTYEVAKAKLAKLNSQQFSSEMHGKYKTFDIDGYDDEKYVLSGGNVKEGKLSVKKEGRYNVTVTIKDKENYTWEDGTNDDLTITVTIVDPRPIGFEETVAMSTAIPVGVVSLAGIGLAIALKLRKKRKTLKTRGEN